MAENTRYVVVDQRGEILQSGKCPSDVAHMQGVGNTISFPVSDEQITQGVYWRDGSFVEYPAKPGDWAIFDYTSEEWIDPRTPADLAAELEALRSEAIQQVNAVSGAIRARFITVIPGQEMLYLLKEREAVDWLAAEAPEIADYPLVAAEIGITADDADQVAQVYVNMAAMLRLTAAQLETLRLGAVVAIEGASDVGAIEAALAQFLGAVQ
ncbi:hypothetical protein [Falsirhodobacter xinxiangensis]|uniref:hypothetical protein n=1 Tax=Falsirhodobacter xinxiangensis TaxID=2530049 RepID=UPI0010AA764B|nr:hypothetical protein [Rhodobacter xinxiangensis]